FHYYRAYRQVQGEDWRALHETYAAAEKLDVAEDAVKDFLNRDIQDTSPRIAYARGVLMGLCNPNELAQRQLTFVAYLLERWGAKLEVGSKPVDEGEGVPPLIADLAADTCPERGERARVSLQRARRHPLLHLGPGLQAAERADRAHAEAARGDRHLRTRQHARGGRLQQRQRLRHRAMADRGPKRPGHAHGAP